MSGVLQQLEVAIRRGNTDAIVQIAKQLERGKVLLLLKRIAKEDADASPHLLRAAEMLRHGDHWSE